MTENSGSKKGGLKNGRHGIKISQKEEIREETTVLFVMVT